MILFNNRLITPPEALRVVRSLWGAGTVVLSSERVTVVSSGL